MVSSAPAEPRAGTTLESPEIHSLLRRAVGFPCLTVLLLCGLLTWQVRGLLRDYGWVTHTQRVLGEINLAQRLLIDHETALRAHLIVGETEFLAPYREAASALPATLERLASETADNSVQLTRISELRRLYDDWKVAADVTVASPAICELSDRGGVLAAMRERKAMMDAMRSIVASMVEEERGLMRTREARVVRADRFVVISGAVLGLVLTGLLVVVFRRWLVRIDATYRRLLDRSAASEERERQARTAAEALAEDILAQSKALERRFTAQRDELEELRGRS